MKKSAPRKTTHNRKVKQVARLLKAQGWRVKADFLGSDRPNPIGKGRYIPDIEATKRGHRKIIEVETPSTLKTDKKQQQTFRRHAGQKHNTTFEIIVAD